MSYQTNYPVLTLVSRVYWIMLGPLLLVLMAVLIIKTGNGWLTGPDFAFLILLAALLFARWLEFQGDNPQTADGQPANASHLRRFLFGAVALGFGGWVAANVIGNYVMTG